MPSWSATARRALHAPYTLENYAAIFGNSLTMRWLLNSVIVALGTDRAAC